MSEASGVRQTDVEQPASPASSGVGGSGDGRAAVGNDVPPAPLCVTNIVFDEPESVDEFGPHQRIADALAALIDGEDKSVAVGIEGAWGSGKTTVINLLRKSIEGRGDYALITFDAWAHEGDPLRRTFLEAIVEQLKEKQQAGAAWINAAEWEKKLDEISQRRTVEENKNVPRLGRWDKALIFSVAFVPLGNALLGAALREEVTIRWGSPAWKFLLELVPGLLFILAPLMVLLARFLKSGAGWDDLNVWTLLSSKGVSETRTETTKTPEPTSIEFEKAFRELTQEALKDPKRKIVLVIDNLDRVDSEDALTIWSTLQTFLQHKLDPRYDWLNRLWTVVLYDPRGLSALWSAPASGTGETAATSVYRSFVDKTFQVRFEVPAPVLSEWRDYLIRKLRAAFPDHSKDWHTVYRVRALHAAARRPTARELKLFVNQIGALHRQWARGGARQTDEYLLPHVACYALLREEYPELLSNLLTGHLPTQDDKNLLGPDLSRSLAGLAFNVERDRGYQMLLEGPIKSALVEGDSAAIKEWAENNDGFWEVLESVVSSNWFGDEPLQLANAAKILEESGVLTTVERHEPQTVTVALCDSASRVSEWPFDKSGRADGLATLCRWKSRLPDHSDMNRFVKGIFRGMTRWLFQDSHRPTIEISQWVDVTRLIARELTANGTPPTSAEEIVATINDLYKAGYNLRPFQVTYSLEVLWEFANQDNPEQAAVGQLYTLATSPDFMEYLKKSSDMTDFTRALCLLTILHYRQGDGWDFPGTADQLEEALGEPGGELVSKFTELLARYKRLPFLLEVANNLPSADKFIMSCLRYIAGEKIEYAERLFTPEAFIKWYPSTWYQLDTEETKHKLMPRLTARLSERTGLINRILDGNFDPNSARFYAAVYEVSEDERLKAWCYRGLKSIGIVWWQKDLRNWGDLAHLISDLGAPQMGEELGEEYQVALRECGAEILEGQLDPEFPILWPPLLEALSRADREQLGQSLLINMGTAKRSIPAKFFEIFGEELADPALLNKQPNIFSSLFTPLVKSKNPGALKWIANVLPKIDIGKIIPNNLEPLSAFREELRQLLDDPVIKGFTSEEHKEANALIGVLNEILKDRGPASGLLVQQ